MTPVAGGAAGARLWNVFLSSTVRDFEDYRALVRDDLHEFAEAACFLSEQWVGGFDVTVARCQTRVQQADAFILLLGFWYGSIPPSTGSHGTAGKSITHIEFDCALERWKDDFPPLAVMMPADASPAHERLTELAEQILTEQAAKGLDRAEHDRRRDLFHKSVLGSWRTVNSFKTEQELTKKALTCVLRWQGKTPDAAAAGQVRPPEEPAESAIDSATLGRLGRTRQLDKANDVLALLAADTSRAGIAIVVHGTADSGLTEFLDALTDAESSLRRIRVRSLPVQQTSIAAFTSWVAKSLGIRADETVNTPEALADQLFTMLKREPVAFILNRAGFIQGGVQAFADRFWKPLYARLQSLSAGQRFQHQMIAIVTDWSGDTASVKSCTAEAADNELPDPLLPVRLSLLGAITNAHVLKWLNEIDVPPERRADLASALLKDDNGNEDGTPSRVFARLRAQDLSA